MLGLGFCAAILALSRGVPALRRIYVEERASALELSEHVTLARTAIGNSAMMAESLRVRRQLLDSLDSRLFTGPSLNSTASNFGAHIANAARASNVELGSLQISVDSSRSGGLRRIAVAATARSDVHGLMRLIASLEAGRKLLRVASLSVSQPDLAGRPDAPEALNIQLTVHALARDRRSK